MASSSGRIPALFGDYKVERVVAKGGMGAVFEVRHRTTGARCAAKTLLKTDSDTGRERFRREAELLARCDRIPGVVKVHSYGETPQGEPFMILDFVDGPSLEHRLVDGERTAPREAATLVREVARALGAIHALGMIHRDVKPGNVLIDAHGKPWLTDFGLAAARDLDKLTKTGVFLGTVSYAAPEQAAGLPCTAASDVFSLGCVLFHLLAGETPIESDSAISHMAQLTAPGPLRDVRSVAKTVPAPLAAIVARCLEKEPRRRYRTGEQLARDLDRFLEGKTLERAPRKSRVPPALAVALVLVVVLVLARRRTENERENESEHVSTVHKPVTLDDWEQDGDARLVAGDVAAAASSYGTALKLASPTRARGLNEKRACALAALGDDEGALACFRAVHADLDRVPKNRNANRGVERAAPALYRKGLATKDAKLLEAAWRLAPPPRDLELAAGAFWREKAALECETWSQGFLAHLTASEKEVMTVVAMLEPAGRVRASGVRFFEKGFAGPALGLIRGWMRNQEEEVIERVGRALVHDWPEEAFSYYILAYSRRRQLGALHDEGVVWITKSMALVPPPTPDEDDEGKRTVSLIAVTVAELYEAAHKDPDFALMEKIVKHGGYADGWLYYSHVLRDAHHFQEALDALDKADGTPMTSNGFYRPAQIQGERLQTMIHLGRREEAKKGALELVSRPSTFLDGGIVLVTLEEWDELASRIDPAHTDEPMLLYWDALALAHLGRTAEAAKLLPRIEAHAKEWAENVKNHMAATK